ncbi:MAG TPA: hypothetical protein VED41_10225, partial [Solirubrobacteraceae bacterium]|nr:hypothetical protein [Solirubrobacteraceae bacterium]
MRAFTATLISLLLLSVLSGTAWAGWSAPRSVSVARYWDAAAAVDGSGDAALAWVNKGADADP